MRVLIYSAWKGTTPEFELYEGLKAKLGGKNVKLYKPHKPHGGRGDKDFRKSIDGFDCIIFLPASFIDGDFEYTLNMGANITRVFVDTLDDFFVRRIYAHPNIKYYFKRELYKGGVSPGYTLAYGIRYAYTDMRIGMKIDPAWALSRYELPIGIARSGSLTKLLPLQLTVTARRVVRARERYDIAFIGSRNTYARLKYVSAVRSLVSREGIKAYIRSAWFSHPIKHEGYISRLAASKAGLAIRGLGYDTFRYWEIPCYGASLHSQRHPLAIPHDFEEGKSALYFSSAGELEQKIKKCIVKSDEWREIARAGQERFFRYHTPVKRAEQILEMVKAT